MCLVIIGPTTQNHAPLGQHALGQQQYFNCWNQCVDQCWANVSTPTMTRRQQLQPLTNVGATIACYLGTMNLNINMYMICEDHASWIFIKSSF